MLGHRQPLASPDGEVFHPAVGKMFYVVGTQCYMPAFFVLQKTAQIYNYPNFFELFSKKTVSKRSVPVALDYGSER